MDQGSDTSAPRTACPVVWLTLGEKADRATARSPELPGDALRAIGAVAEGCRRERDFAVRVQRILNQRELPGAAIVHVPVGRPDPPAAPLITVPFEPMELNEANRSLQGICNVNPGPDGPHLPAPGRSRLRWAAMRTSMPVSVAAGLAACMMMSALLGRAGTPFYFVLGALGLVVLFALALSYPAAQWFLVPGGVVVRRFAFGRSRVALDRYTPADAVLVLQHKSPGWEVRIWREREKVSRMLTVFEAVALLGAWRSPLAPPPLHQLSDLR